MFLRLPLADAADRVLADLLFDLRAGAPAGDQPTSSKIVSNEKMEVIAQSVKQTIPFGSMSEGQEKSVRVLPAVSLWAGSADRPAFHISAAIESRARG